MDRRRFMVTMGAGAASMAMAGPARGEPTKHVRKRNVLLYVVDDQGMDDAGCYGNPVIKTPGLDLLASEGTRFTQAFCTTPSCSASRSVILSGLYNHANGQYGHQHAYHHFASFPEVRSLPVLLGNAGYRTLCAGKYHVAPEEVYHFQEYLKPNEPATLADQCRSLIASEETRPFFLYCCTTEPHRPFVREGSDSFDPAEVVVPPYLPDTPECRAELAQYYGSVQRADRGLLRLIDILKETGRWEDTLVIYVSDNGIAFPGAKTNVYEPGVRLPCVIRDPARERGNIACDALVNWADLAPTICDYAGVQPPEKGFHGRSLRPILGQEHPEGWDETCLSHTFHEITMYYPMRVVRQRRYKLIWNMAHGLPFPFASDLWESLTWQGIVKSGATQYGRRAVEAYLHRPRFELYDLEADPDEIHNLADDPAHAAVLEELKVKLRAFQERTGDPWILKWEYE